MVNVLIDYWPRDIFKRNARPGESCNGQSVRA